MERAQQLFPGELSEIGYIQFLVVGLRVGLDLVEVVLVHKEIE